MNENEKVDIAEEAQVTSQMGFTSIILSCLFVIGAASFKTSTAAAEKTDFTVLESISYDEVCGIGLGGKTSCFKGSDFGTWVPDSVGKLTSAYSNELLGCGQDADGWQCWKISAGAINGISYDTLFRKFLENANPQSIRLGAMGACAINSKTNGLHCLMTHWESANKEFHKKPKRVIRAIAVHNDYVCWADGDFIECLAEDPRWAWPKKMEIAEPIEIAIGNDFICARSLTEAKCWSEQAPDPDQAVEASVEILNSPRWLVREDALCALTQNQRFICTNPSTGEVMDHQERRHLIPLEYSQPNSEIQDAWVSNSSGCVKLKNGTVNCWSWWNATAYKVEFRERVEAIFGSGFSPCGILESGQVECRLTYVDVASLPKPDRVRVEFGGYNRCYWNSGGVECRGRNEKIEFKSVKAVSASSSGEGLCVVGVEKSAAFEFDSVRCFTYDVELNTPPVDLSNPTHVATSEDRACAVSEEGLTCWGESYQGTSPPSNVSNPKKLLMASSHGCLLDDFGFACWGDLANLQLEIPDGLDQPGKITDFALGASRTCVTLDTGNVQCWGRDFDRSGPPPTLRKTTSILGRGSLFCALAETGLHCWGGYTDLPK